MCGLWIVDCLTRHCEPCRKQFVGWATCCPRVFSIFRLPERFNPPKRQGDCHAVIS
ncbi:MAG: hypothetical protein IKZ88_02725 [Neisseriaceae bacterium]|nr:hypothetical protein [Neisseriaceae bacterium]